MPIIVAAAVSFSTFFGYQASFFVREEMRAGNAAQMHAVALKTKNIEKVASETLQKPYGHAY